MQARFIEATIARFDSTQPGFVEAWNPVSSVYGARMVDSSRLHFWAWDARPFPAYPDLGLLWADAQDWETGHWLNGRLEGMPLDRLVTALAADSIPTNAFAPRPDVTGFLDGYVLDRAMSARAAIEPLADVFAFDPIVSGGAVRFSRRARTSTLTLGADDIVPDRDGALLRLTRAQESELPHELALTFGDSDNDYATATVLSRRIEGWSQRRAETESAMMTNRALAQQRADVRLEDIWSARETAEFQVRPTLAALEPGDVVTIDSGTGGRRFLVTHIADGRTRAVTARAIDVSVYDRAPPTFARRVKAAPRAPGPPHVVTLDLAIARNEPVTTQYIAACADPWPGALAVFRTIGGAFDPVATLRAPATIGETLDALGPGPVGAFDRGASLTIKLYSGEFAAIGDALALEGRATMAICGPDGAWEMFAFADAELVANRTYRLSRFLRGLGGEESLALRTVAAGAKIVLLDRAVVPLASGLSSIGAANDLRVGPADRNPGDQSYVSVKATATAKALLPYAPVRARATRSASGVTIAFLRRGRIDADAWESLDIPLGEDAEAYRIAIARPSGGPRVLMANAPSALYAAADFAADFPTPPTALDLTIQQISASVGAGFPLSVHLPIQ